MDLEIVGRRGNAIIVAVSFDMTKARPFGLAFCLCFLNVNRNFHRLSSSHFEHCLTVYRSFFGYLPMS